MSRNVKQPVGQKRLTNIAVVRLKKGGKRFEIACYRNKVGDWRSGIEKDLDEVLQTTTIFSNVGKGVAANKEDLQAAFGTTDDEQICLEILTKGELQVSDKERRVELDNLFKDVVNVLVEKTVNPQTGRPYTLTLLERALRDLHFNPDHTRSAKQQALEVLPLLKARIPIERARMRLRIQVPPQHQQQLRLALEGATAVVEAADEEGDSVVYTVQVDPGRFRALHAFVQDGTDRAGRMEVLAFAVQGGNAAAEDFTISAAAAAATPPATPQPPAPEPSASAAASAAANERGAAARHEAPAPQPRVDHARGGSGGGALLYARGPVAALPEEYASRRERFEELEGLQPGWTVELRQRGEVVEAVFFSPQGDNVGSFANARRMALQGAKQRQAAA